MGDPDASLDAFQPFASLGVRAPRVIFAVALQLQGAPAGLAQRRHLRQTRCQLSRISDLI